jgi:esterase/lipase superfamily enzyme
MTRLKGGHTSWFSHRVGREMHVRWFGRGRSGARLLAFPTSMGNHNEWPNRYMPDVLQEHIERGWITLFCLDHNHDDSWYNKRIPPRERARRHLAYDAYLREELLPFTAHQAGPAFLIAAGASFGAYHAMSFGLRNPTLVDRIIGMSGMYDISGMADGSSDELVYQCNPHAFIPHERERERLEALQRQDIIIAIGNGDPMCEENQRFSGVLWNAGIGNALRVWDGFAHDWPWWERMILRYVGGHD